MTPVFGANLGLSIFSTDIGAQKIDSSALKTYKMAIAGSSIQDKLGRARVFEETFLLADTSMEVVLEIPFLALRNADILFPTKSFIWRSYSVFELLSTARWVKLIDKHKFSRAALDEKSETFIIHVAAMKVLDLVIHHSWTPLLATL